MRLSGQVLVIAVLGAAGFGGWYAYKEGKLSTLPVIGSYFRAGDPAAGGPGRPRAGAAGPPAAVDVDTVRTGRIVEIREAVGTVRAFEFDHRDRQGGGIIDQITLRGRPEGEGRRRPRLPRRRRTQGGHRGQPSPRASRASALRNEIATRLERAMALRRTGAGTEAQVDDLTAQVRTLESAIASAEAQRKARRGPPRGPDRAGALRRAGRAPARSPSAPTFRPARASRPSTSFPACGSTSRCRRTCSAGSSPGRRCAPTSPAFVARIFQGRVSIVDTRVDPVTRSIRLTAEFDNPDEALKPGMFLGRRPRGDRRRTMPSWCPKRRSSARACGTSSIR